VSVYYVDTSAALKLLAEESHSKAFAAFYDANDRANWVSSALLRVELIRAVRRALPAAENDARELLLAFDYLDIDEAVVDTAMNEPDPLLRTLDAIHLASARSFEDALTALVTYDDRLATAASGAGIAVVSPRD
jgi:predicted nucleic acid-binding protein